MHTRQLTYAGIGALVLLILLMNSLFVVHQTQQALVLQFGRPVRMEQTPGLKFKLPFVQNIELFDTRLMAFDTPPDEVIASDKKRLIVDAFVRYRITNPLAFYQSVRNENGLTSRLSSNVRSALREAINNQPLHAILSEQRAPIMQEIRDTVNKAMMQEEAKNPETGERVRSGYGIRIVDVRIMRADLPQENSEAIYRRMQTERESEAKKLRAEGAEEAQKIRAEAEKQRTVMLAVAQRDSEKLRGEGDGEASQLYAAAFNQDSNFFDFYRSMQAYRRVLDNKDTTMVLSPDSGFLRQFEGK